MNSIRTISLIAACGLGVAFSAGCASGTPQKGEKVHAVSSATAKPAVAAPKPVEPPKKQAAAPKPSAAVSSAAAGEKRPVRIELLCPRKPDPPPVIDGDDREWKLVPNEIAVEDANVTYGRQHFRGEDDLSGTVKLCYDDNYLYLLASVVDEKIVVVDGKIFQTDHIELTLVPRFDEKKTGPVSQESLFIFGFTPGSPDKVGDPLLDIDASANMAFPPGKPWDGVDTEATMTEDGYLLEARIPWRVFGLKSSDIKEGAVMGVDVHFSDSDNSPTQEKMTSLNSNVPWRGRRWENLLKMTLVGTDGRKK